MFNPGDYVTGKDRSYKRSIYQVISMDDDGMFTVQFICLNGQLGRKQDVMQRKVSDFRLATEAEIKDGLDPALSINLVNFVYRLLTKSYRGRR